MITADQKQFISKHVDCECYDAERLTKYLSMHDIVGVEIFQYCEKEKPDGMLGGRKTVICEFLGTGMMSVMPVPLLLVHPRECSQRGHIRYAPSVCAYRWTCRELPHKLPLQAL